ncbi:MAG: DmsC/YnfH family molybdoenzyme membrane anchor subunit [Chloroflexota bacterium]
MNLREWALPVYTILMQLASGAMLFLWVVRSINFKHNSKEEIEEMSSNPVFVILLTIGVAMAGSHFHLSKPYFSFLAMLNVNSSWLSREIVLTVLFFFSVGILSFLQTDKSKGYRLNTTLGWLSIGLGLANVYCMSVVYLLPTQEAWDTPFTIISFYGSTLLLGISALAALLVLDLKFVEIREPLKLINRTPIIQRALSWFSVVAVAMAGLIIITNFYQISLLYHGSEPAKTSLQLLLEIYWVLLAMRFVLLFAGVGWLAISAYLLRKERKTVNELVIPVYVSCLLVLIGEILGRFLFYASHVRLGM